MKIQFSGVAMKDLKRHTPYVSKSGMGRDKVIILDALPHSTLSQVTNGVHCLPGRIYELTGKRAYSEGDLDLDLAYQVHILPKDGLTNLEPAPKGWRPAHWQNVTRLFTASNYAEIFMPMSVVRNFYIPALNVWDKLTGKHRQ